MDLARLSKVKKYALLYHPSSQYEKEVTVHINPKHLYRF
tara:strand:- start:226 stop:342 length:117 start_codon:yes stop_codon:yes gene_type:complete